MTLDRLLTFLILWIFLIGFTSELTSHLRAQIIEIDCSKTEDILCHL